MHRIPRILPAAEAVLSNGPRVLSWDETRGLIVVRIVHPIRLLSTFV